ncbi:glutamine synthetase-like [Synchiropus splendidus]|uniref:glutamine synthetase-like n=1 Tax=Synchiropus splendidus TaxID=270530 RepID=UPI00237EB74B|nr:glutamine synthetase-like [Synchiropus splendidus]
MSTSESLVLHKNVRERFLSLETVECLVTYVWIDQTGENLKNKTRTLDKEPVGISDIPEWETTSVENDSIQEVYLVPARMFRDPFLRDPNKMVLCEVFNRNRQPAVSNQRSKCSVVMKHVMGFEPWFGMEQEFTLFHPDGRPFGWVTDGSEPEPVSCCVGFNKVFGRDVSICHYKACLYAGIKMFGTNSEDLPSQWEFQVGPCEGIEMGDHLWMSRYILHRVCEDFGLVASLDVVPVKSIHVTSGCHVNFSTKEMRSEGGLRYIEEAIEKLSKRHHQHLQVYDPRQGRDNMSRLISHSTTSSFTHFSSAVAERNVSVRIPGLVSRRGCGYLEDRRPASNCDPYTVTAALIETCLLDSLEQEEETRVTTEL